MIITGITADNFLKYGRLELDDLPAQGMIAVSGLNESGRAPSARPSALLCLDAPSPWNRVSWKR